MRRAWLVVGVVVAACSSTDAKDEACGAVAKARCEHLSGCSASDFQRQWVDEATCEARLKLGCARGLDAEGTGATPESVQACAAAIPNQSCDDFFQGNTPTECLPAAGSLGDGTPCIANGECSSTFCAVPAHAQCGACAPLPQVGDACDVIGCGGRGLICDSVTEQCVTPVEAGGTCGRGDPCVHGYTCVRPSGGQSMGSCMLQGVTAGATCDPMHRTGSDCNRDAGLYCDTTTKECKVLSYAASLAPCGNLSGVVTVCVSGALCTQSDTCAAPVLEGMACDPTYGPPCLAPARCVIPALTADAGTDTDAAPAAMPGTCVISDSSMCPST
jgi:hypothetical protein